MLDIITKWEHDDHIITKEEVEETYASAEKHYDEATMERMEVLRRIVDTGLPVRWYGPGLVTYDKTGFILSLKTNKWRVAGKNVWYRRTKDEKKFVEDYVMKELDNERKSMRDNYVSEPQSAFYSFIDWSV